MSEESMILERIRDHRSIVSLRHILARGYDRIGYRIVWGIIEENLDQLEEDADAILRDG